MNTVAMLTSFAPSALAEVVRSTSFRRRACNDELGVRDGQRVA